MSASLPSLGASFTISVMAALPFCLPLHAQCSSQPPPPPIRDATPPPPPSYRGPADVTPSGPRPNRPSAPGPVAPSPGAPTTGGPLGPTAAPPSGPSTGGAAGPSAGVPVARGGAPRTGPRGMPIGEDLTTWQHWWDFNQDTYLRPRNIVEQPTITGSDDFYLGATRRREANQGIAPDRLLVVGEVLPALRRAVEQGPRDVTVAAMLALARIGIDHPEFRVAEVLAPQLRSSDQTTRETAALALGLAGQTAPHCRELLLDVLRDSAAGRRAVGSTVDDRTRSFAAYGLGLLANGTDSVPTKRKVFQALSEALNDREASGRDIRVAAVQAISLLAIDLRSYEGARLATEVLASLDSYFSADLGVSEQIAQAHCPTAIARLLTQGETRAERFKERFAGIIAGRAIDGGSPASQRISHSIAQSCALALGQLCRPNEDGDVGKNPDVHFSNVLYDAWCEHKDAQTRNFALLALGQIGGAENKKKLVRAFDKASSSIQQPWCALALGLYSAQEQARTGAPDRLIGETLLASLQRSKDPEAAAALAIGVGLARADGSNDVVAHRLLDEASKDSLASALCQGMALLGDKAGCEALHDVLEECGRRPELLENAAIALGQLGDPHVGELLMKRLVDGEANYSMQVALATALADIGDRRQVQPLLTVLADTQRSAITRTGAARALGGIAGKRQLRWNTPLRANANYRANVATFTDRVAGVLDLR